MNSRESTDALAAAKSEKPPYKRRIFLIQRSLQFKYAVITFCLFGLAAFMVWWETYQGISGLSRDGLISDPVVMAWLRQITKIVFGKIVISLALVWILSILLSHYVAGPIYRFQKSLETLRDLDLSKRVHLRQKDELKNLQNVFNEALDRIEYSVRKDRDKATAMATHLEKLAKKADKASAEELHTMAGDLRRMTRDFIVRND